MKKILPVLAILAVLIPIFISNFSFGKILLGWDALSPELNLPININRALATTWQEYQGLGLLGGMGHGADLVRQLVFAVFLPFVGKLDIRYFWTFLMLGLGPIGVYFLSKKLLGQKSELMANISAFAAGMFYLFNLATLQVFYNPFETFTAFYAALPWLLYGLVRYLRQSTKKNLVVFGLISLLATPAFYVQTLFVVWIILLGIMLFGSHWKKIIVVLATVFATNAFWLLPATYFTATKTSVVAQSKGNILSTNETYLMNKGFGTIDNIALLKGYWFEYLDAAASGEKFGYLYQDWREYTSDPVVQTIGYALFIFAVCGLVLSAFLKTSPKRYWPLAAFMLTLFILGAGNDSLTNIPILGQAFRSVFTKWSTVMALVLALGIGFFASFLRKKYIVFGVAVLFIAMSIFVAKPFLDGKLISDRMKVSLPESYFDLFTYFKSQPKQNRIAYFPVQSHWGWNFYNWGYRGSGFLWYGIEQPILDRAFDVWSSQNETFYQEYATAVYQSDARALRNVLDKYDVTYVLVDKSVIIPEADSKLLRFDEIEQLMGEIGVKAAWQKDFLTVYQIQNTNQSFVSAPASFLNAYADASYLRFDSIFQTVGNYVGKKQVMYPLVNLLREQIRQVRFGQNRADFSFTQPVKRGETLVIPAAESDLSYSVAASIRYEASSLSIDFDPFVTIKDGQQTIRSYDLPSLSTNTKREYQSIIITLGGAKVRVNQGQTTRIENIKLAMDKPLELDIYDATAKEIVLDKNYLKQEVENCWSKPDTTPLVQSEFIGGTVRITVRDAAGCISGKIGRLGGEKSLLSVTLPYKSENGSRPYFCVVEEGKTKCETDDVFYHSFSSKTWSEVSREVVLDGQKVYWLGIGGRPSDTQGETWSISYQMPKLMQYVAVASFDFFPNQWPELTQEKRFTFSKDSRGISVSLIATPALVNVAQGGRAESFNCDVFKRGDVKKQIVGRVVEYQASDYGASCDFAVLDAMKTNNEYLLRVVGENVSGRSLKFYLFNKATNRNDLEMLLANEDFDESFAVVDWDNFDENEYVLNFETRSFGPETAHNKIERVEVYQMPLSWISTLRLQTKPATKIENTASVTKQFSKTGTYFYRGKVSSGIRDGVVVLSQGYDAGWVAFSEGKVLPHYEFNGWANAWEVLPGEHSVTIFYLPQLLQFLGFGALFIAVVHLTIHLRLHTIKL